MGLPLVFRAFLLLAEREPSEYAKIVNRDHLLAID
jgi:hypothetical protein